MPQASDVDGREDDDDWDEDDVDEESEVRRLRAQPCLSQLRHQLAFCRATRGAALVAARGAALVAALMAALVAARGAAACRGTSR